MRNYVALLALLLWFDSYAAGSPASPPDTQLRVVILDVNDFDPGSSFRDDDLDRELLSAGSQLNNFFKHNYGVTPEFLYRRSDTTSEALRKWLGNYFATTQQTVTLVFVLTHGVGSFTKADTAYNSELYLATSDASQTNITSKGLKARAELLSYFKELPNGSSVFLFIDTCDAASINSEGLKRDLDADGDHKMMILAASKATKKSYQARFTRTLQRIWEEQSPPCTHSVDDVEKLVTESMDRFFPVNVPVGEQQEVKLVRAYTQDFCIESFGADQSLLLVANPSPNRSMEISWRQDGDLQDSATISIDAHSIHPFRLLRRQYRLHAEIEDAESFSFPVNLNSGHSVQLVIAKPNPTAAEISSLGQGALDVVAMSGMPPAEITAFTNTVQSQLSAQADSAVTRKANADRVADHWTQQVAEITALETAAAAEAQSSEQNAENAKRELLTCCHRTNPVGIETVDSAELQKKRGEAEQAEQSALALQDNANKLASERAKVELSAAEAHISVVDATKQRDEARVALSDFAEAVQARQDAEQIAKRGQQQLADHLTNPLWKSERTDRGIIVTIDYATLRSRGVDVDVALQTLRRTLREAIPDALVEVEAYSADGNSNEAKSTADSVGGVLAKPSSSSTLGYSPALHVVTRGFGRKLLTTDSGISKTAPSSLQIVISSTELGYPDRPSLILAK
jgi:hypothetical protein